MAKLIKVLSVKHVGALLVILSTVTAGCAPGAGGEDSQVLSKWPETLNDFTIVWSAEPGIDLVDEPATITTRAYLESYQLAYLTGDRKNVYPGFAQAASDNPNVLPSNDRPIDPPWVGTEKNHIVQIDKVGREVKVFVCSYMYGVAQQGSDGTYVSESGGPFEPEPGIFPIRITLNGPADLGPELPPQEGPARVPTNDVFGGWSVTGHSGGYFIPAGSSSAGYEADRQSCATKAPDNAERRKSLTELTHPRSAFPALPPFPGWPAKPGS